MKQCSLCKENKPIGEFYYRANRCVIESQCKLCMRKKSHQIKQTQEYYLYRIKDKARKSNLPFNLDISDFSIPEICPVLHIPLFRGVGKATGNSPSIDRIIPSKGYVKGNTKIISYRANSIKNDATLEELKKVLAYMKTNNCE